MLKTLAKILSPLALAAALAYCGGSSGGLCVSKGPCPNDPTLTSDQVNACNALLSDPKCGAKATAAAQCNKDHSMCDSNGMSTKNDPACMQANADYSNCLLGK